MSGPSSFNGRASAAAGYAASSKAAPLRHRWMRAEWAFAALFATYLVSVAVHVGNFEDARAAAEVRGRADQHQGHAHATTTSSAAAAIAPDTPFHAFLRHSHREVALLGGGSGSGQAVNGGPSSPPGGGNPGKKKSASASASEVAKREPPLPQEEVEEEHARLVCPGGQSDGSEQGLVYWHRATPAEDRWRSPWRAPDSEGPRYVLFESDNGGWNNVRMSLESVFVFARATGRTLVLPPPQPFYFPDPGVEKKDYFANTNSYEDFFPLKEMEARLGPNAVISMETFLERECFSGRLFEGAAEKREGGGGGGGGGGAAAAAAAAAAGGREEGAAAASHAPPLVPLAPPWRRHDPAALAKAAVTANKLRDYLRGLGDALDNETYWLPHFKDGGRLEFLAFPAAAAPSSAANASGTRRRRRTLEAFAAGRRALDFDEGPWRRAKVVHFASWPKRKLRLLMHFYTLFHFPHDDVDRRMKRFVRDHLRYHDSLWCAAQRVLTLLRRDAQAHPPQGPAPPLPQGPFKSPAGPAAGPAASYGLAANASAPAQAQVEVEEEGGGGGGGEGFSTLHVRHGDFQFKVVRMGAEEIVEQTRDILANGELLYIATDEAPGPARKAFFAPLVEAGHALRFLDDYLEEAGLKGPAPLPLNFLGMVDTLVAAQGRTFIGTWFSTFSGYITRLRGYKGLGRQSFYFFAKKKFALLAEDQTPSDPFYTREWPTAWEAIDG